MYDLRKIKIIDLKNSICLKENTAYKFKESLTGKNLIAKFISDYDDTSDDDMRLISEFKKLVLLSGEPEIATVYYLCKGKLSNKAQNCYVMDFIDGKNLNDFLENKEKLIYEVLYDILIQLVSGLEKAHYHEVYHRDLHKGNIIINEYGYLKIIDFLWADFLPENEQKHEKDLKDFKQIVLDLESKCRNEDKHWFEIISKYCASVNTIKGLKKEIELIDSLSFEYSLLDIDSINILSKLFDLTETSFSLKKVLTSKECEIPDIYIPPITKQEETFIEKNIKNAGDSRKLQYSDSRIEKINNNLNHKFDFTLNSLKQLNLLEWRIWVNNTGTRFRGPYDLNYEISFTSKFHNWKKINQYIGFVTPNTKSINELILGE